MPDELLAKNFNAEEQKFVIDNFEFIFTTSILHICHIVKHYKPRFWINSICSREILDSKSFQKYTLEHGHAIVETQLVELINFFFQYLDTSVYHNVRENL